MVPKRNGAGNETRTRDPHLGKVVLYQLSYSRSLCRGEAIPAGFRRHFTLSKNSYSQPLSRVARSFFLTFGQHQETSGEGPNGADTARFL